MSAQPYAQDSLCLGDVHVTTRSNSICFTWAATAQKMVFVLNFSRLKDCLILLQHLFNSICNGMLRCISEA